MNDTRRLLHELDITVRWGEMDALGHVNNAVYFRYLEQTRISWLEGLRSAAMSANDGIVIVNAECTFLRPIVYPASIRISMYCGPPGRSSFMASYEITDIDDATLYSTGSTKVVWVNYEAGKSAPLPEFIRELLPAA